MKKTFAIFAALALVLAPVMAQDAEDTFPNQVAFEYGYLVNGHQLSTVTTGMAKQIVAIESQINDSVVFTMRRWYSKDWGKTGSGYDTIARYIYKGKQAVLVEDKRLEAEYKDSLWNVQWTQTALSKTDTVKEFTFNYSGSKYLKFYGQTDTAYTAYAGRPYRIKTVDNPLQLPLNYTSSNPGVATVNAANGFITVVDKGETIIKAKFPGDENIKADSAEWKLVVKEGDHFDLQIMALEQTEHKSGSGSTYMAFDMVKVTEANCNDILGDGKLSFDIKTRTLTMNNFQKLFTDKEDDSMGWMDWLDYSSGPLPLTIKVVGNCFVRHNSAGMFCDWDMIITGDGNDKSRLTMEGRFPQFSAGNNLTIDGCQVHALESTPHPLLICNVLRVEDNSYFEAHMNIEVGPGEDPTEYGAAVGQVEDVEFGEHIIMYSKDVHVKDGIFVDGNDHIALRVEIGPKVEDVIAGDVNFSAVELTDDPTGTQQDGILYTLTVEDGVNKSEGCLVITSHMDLEQMDNIVDVLTPGSAAFAENFHGLTILLPVGKGNINISMQTTSIYHLAVQIGKNQPSVIQQKTKTTVQIPFDCKIATYAYIFAIIPKTPSVIRRFNLTTEDPLDCVKLYSLSLTDEGGSGGGEEALDNINAQNVSVMKVLVNGQLIIFHDGNAYNITGARIQ